MKQLPASMQKRQEELTATVECVTPFLSKEQLRNAVSFSQLKADEASLKENYSEQFDWRTLSNAFSQEV